MKNVPALALAALSLVSFAACQTTTQCKASCASFYSDLELATWDETLRKASLSIAGRLPDSFEKDFVRQRGQAGLEDVLDQMMKEEPFYDRLKEIYNDFLLTDRYIIDGTTILDEENYPNRDFYKNLGGSLDGGDSQESVASAYGANFGIGREPLNIIAHVVRQDRNFGEIITGDYTLVNAYSAQSYGLQSLTFVGDPFDKNNLLEVKLAGHPHAGVLTTPSFLNVFPTSATNRNRARSRWTHFFFLDFDVLTLGKRPLSTTDISGENPTMNDPNCTTCHTTVDPLAGLFQSWDDQGRYRPRDWYKDMFPPAFKGAAFNASAKQDGTQFMGPKLVKEPGFARSAVKAMFKGLTGQATLNLPDDSLMDTPDGESALAAFDAQSAVITEITKRFNEANMNLKVVAKNIILSPYFRAKNIKDSADPQRLVDYKDIGMGRMLTPEMLNRKIKTVLALDRFWGEQGDLAPTEYLLSNDFFLIYYGGIDSVATTTRILAPNGISTNVAKRMSNELACRAVALDLSVPIDKRALLPNVTSRTIPENVDDPDAALGNSAKSVRDNIQFLHSRLLAEDLPADDPEIERTMALFMETLREGRDAVASGQESPNLPNECKGTQDSWTKAQIKGGLDKDPEYAIRSWMAVVSYLMADYKFIYE
jgi:hypothetical protein